MSKYFYKSRGCPKFCKKKIQKKIQKFFDFTFFGARSPSFVFHFYKTRGFSNTKVGARKPPYFCLRALDVPVVIIPSWMRNLLEPLLILQRALKSESFLELTKSSNDG